MRRWQIDYSCFWIGSLRPNSLLSRRGVITFFGVFMHKPGKQVRSVLGATPKKSFIAIVKYLIFVASISLLGCFGNGLPTDLIKIPKKVAGTADSEAVVLQKKLANQGVQVITIGQDYLIAIPSSALFPDQSPRLNWQSYYLLNRVVLYLRQFRKVAVNVTAYSSQYGSTRREDALTLARAKVISRYLWSQCIDSRFIFAEGAGREKPISAYLAGGDQSINSRIEITFRDAII